MLSTMKFGMLSQNKQNNTSLVASKPMAPVFRGGVQKVAIDVADKFVSEAEADLGQIKLVERARQALAAGEGDRASLLYKIALPKVLKKFSDEAAKVSLYMTEMSNACLDGAGTLFQESANAAVASIKVAKKAVNEAETEAMKAGSKEIEKLAERNIDNVSTALLGTQNAKNVFAGQAIEENKFVEFKTERKAKAVKEEVEAIQYQLRLQELQQMQEKAMQPVKEKAEFGFKI